VEALPPHYRPDIDGLRAIAILVVVAYHAFPGRITGGFVGVDIFFVISGYLITDIIFSEILANKFSIAGFYARRVRRIFPALIATILVTFAAGCFILPPKDLQSLGSNIAGSAVFLQNIVLLGQVGYFDIAADKKPLLHFWSLGIEEQYYIAWPAMLLMVRRWGLNVITATCVLIVASFWLGIVVLKKNVDLAFYLPFTRAWELLVGSVVAIWMRRAQAYPISRMIAARLASANLRIEHALQDLVWNPEVAPRGNLTQDTLAIAAIATIVFAVLRFNATTPFPGAPALLPVVAAAILILTPQAWINRLFLAASPMVFVGLISYPLYLWHFPLMAYARIVLVDGVPWPVMVAVVAASFVLAWLTYRLIERPFRFGKAHRRAKMAALLIGMVFVGLLGLLAYQTQGLPGRIPQRIRGFMLTGEETSVHWRRGSCLLLPDQGAENFTPDCAGDGSRPLLFAWGDSYAAALAPGLMHFARERGFGVAQYTASACPPLIDFTFAERPFCKSINDHVLQRIKELRPDVVILHSTWSYGATEMDKGLRETVPRLRALNIKKIVLLGPVSTWKGSGLAANVLDYYYEHGSLALIPERTTYRSNDEWTRALEAFLEVRARELGIDYISARAVMCNQDGCLARIGDNGSELTAYDSGHMTLPGSVFMAGSIIDRLLKP
jgi:peptidoglycan/LPS O-acetylase OafA/YrhL